MNLVIKLFLAALCFVCAQAIAAKQEHPYFQVVSGERGNDGSEFVDTRTGLIWKRCVVGKVWDPAAATCTGVAHKMSWDVAVEFVKKLPRPAGDPWRLPTPFELMSIVDSVCRNPAGCRNAALDPKWFGTSEVAFLWSDAPYLRMTDYAWGIDVARGELSYEMKNDTFPLRLVRSAP